MGDIFISYAKKNKRFVEKLSFHLQSQGWTVWWDSELRPGDLFAKAIEAEIKASSCMIVVWSADSVRSDYVIAEANEGRKRRILVPVLSDDIEPPFPFGDIQAARLVDWNGSRSHQGFEKLVWSVAQKCGWPRSQSQDAKITSEASRFPIVNKSGVMTSIRNIIKSAPKQMVIISCLSFIFIFASIVVWHTLFRNTSERIAQLTPVECAGNRLLGGKVVVGSYGRKYDVVVGGRVVGETPYCFYERPGKELTISCLSGGKKTEPRKLTVGEWDDSLGRYDQFTCY